MPSVESRASRLSRYLRQAALLFGLPGGTGAWSGHCEHSAEVLRGLNSYTTPALAVGLAWDCVG